MPKRIIEQMNRTLGEISKLHNEIDKVLIFDRDLEVPAKPGNKEFYEYLNKIKKIKESINKINKIKEEQLDGPIKKLGRGGESLVEDIRRLQNKAWEGNSEFLEFLKKLDMHGILEAVEVISKSSHLMEKFAKKEIDEEAFEVLLSRHFMIKRNIKGLKKLLKDKDEQATPF